jgi:glycosyltransferase involved in cell wall biosynthesis
MKKNYINLVPIASGGGLQNAINLILGILEIESEYNNYIFIIGNEKLEKICLKKDLNFIKVKNNKFHRLFFELFFFINKKNNIIFTLFGASPLFSYNNTTINGCAYSNLFYPEIDFWDYLPFYKKIIKKIKDFYRYMVIKISDVVIFETDILKDRAVNYKDFPDEDTYVVKMAVNKIVEEAKNIGSSNNYLKSYKDKFKILYLASSHPNKRQHLLIDIAKFFKENNENICFITTMDERKKYSKEFINKIKKNNLEDYIINLGPIDSSDVGSLINEVDAMINIAKLESFSNNFIEAWTFNKLLILTDADWSRGSCKESAIYIEPEKIIESAKKIVKIKDNHNKRNEIISTYQNRLDEYFDYKEKTKKYLEIISKYSG